MARYASGPGGINGAHSASPHEMGLGGHEAAGPDATRGYDVQEYGKIWQALAQEKQWPSVQRFSVIGPSGAEFLETVKGVVSSTTGEEPEKIEVVAKTRFQSVRLDVRCASPDDFCLLHSRLKSIPKARFVKSDDIFSVMLNTFDSMPTFPQNGSTWAAETGAKVSEMSLAVKAGTAKPGLQRLGQVRAPSGHFVPESHLNELARMLDSTSAVSGFRVRRIGINDSVWLVTCPANPEGWMIKKVPARRRYSGVPTDVENCDALIRKFPGIVEDQRLAFPHSVVAIHSLSAPWSSQASDHVADLLVSRRVPGDQLGVYLAELDLTKSQDQTALEEVCAGVGEMLADFHARYADPVTGEATYHTDFHPSNVLYEKKTGTLSIVDLTGMGNPGAGDDVQKFERLIFGMAGERYALAFRHRYLAMAKTSVCKTDRSSSKSTCASSTDALWAVPSFHLPAPPTRTGSFKTLSSLAVPESGFNPDKHLTTLAFMLSPGRVCEPQLTPLSSKAKAWVLRQGSANECWVIQQASPLFAERCEEFVRLCPSILEDAQLAFPHSAIPLQAHQKQVGSLLVAECSFRTTLEQYAATLDQTTSEDQAKLQKVLTKTFDILRSSLAKAAGLDRVIG
ncbi:hypothetical protein AK812_SmicGene12445 [Symbiodinium microadriaticum]|uniref:Uncharacterized protein n=1 Tax=Symbiodinium microadriaticum TaxID=2951 RepID=A0A1Q9EAP1_SYMMI|nr:hypothetical protein AK812_SmicGene12445 [Symbiodinium microadriaticum]